MAACIIRALVFMGAAEFSVQGVLVRGYVVTLVTVVSGGIFGDHKGPSDRAPPLVKGFVLSAAARTCET